MALDTEAKRRRAMRSIFGLGLRGHTYLVADGSISKNDRSQIIGYYFEAVFSVVAIDKVYVKSLITKSQPFNSFITKSKIVSSLITKTINIESNI